MKKDYVINGCLAISSVIVFLLAIEIALRVTNVQTTTPNPPQIYMRDPNPNISYKLKPNLENEEAYRALVSTDSYGFRLNERSNKTVILGDSIAFGYGVEYDQTLAAHLGARNAAVPGYQLQQQRALYEDYVTEVNHDSVMLVFYWNDLDGFAPGKLDDDGILRSSEWKPSDDQRSWLEKHSAFYIAFKKLISLKSSKQHQQQIRKMLTGAKKDPVDTELLDAYIEDLKSFATILPQEKTFVIWPDNYLHEETRATLINGAMQAGFTVIDLYDLFGNNVPTLLWDTVHPHPDALKKAAEYIQEQL